MHKGSECNNCIKLNLCKIINTYNSKCAELKDTNNNNFVTTLNCKHYEKRIKNDYK